MYSLFKTVTINLISNLITYKVRGMIQAQQLAGDNKGANLLQKVEYSLQNLEVVRANITITYKGTFIDNVKTNWMELSNGVKIQ